MTLVAHTYNSCPLQAIAEGLQVGTQPGLYLGAPCLQRGTGTNFLKSGSPGFGPALPISRYVMGLNP